MTRLFLLLTMLLVSGSIQMSPAVTMDKLQESWKLYMDECEHNNSRAPPSTEHSTSTPVGPTDCPTRQSACRVRGFCRGTIKFSMDWCTKTVMLMASGLLRTPASVTPAGPVRKLHCMRNNIHMNLFASFILRALSILIKDALMEANITSQDLSWDQEQGFSRASLSPVDLLVDNEITVSCRVAAVMMQYSILANSYWLLVEGIYLHNLLVITVFTERNYFQIYLCIGWGTPLLFLVPWVIAKYLYENHECWGQNINMSYWWIIRSPILVAVVINFLIFIHIIKILVSKLRAHQMRYTDYKFRLAKSTLTLIPLLGIHQVVFIYVTDEATETTIGLRLTKLVIDLFFSSFQGLLVAILYCFVNKEVQSEVLKKWKRWKLGRNIEEEYRHTYSNTPNTKTASLLNHVSQRLPQHEQSMPVCGPEEWHALVANGKAAGPLGTQPVEDVSLLDKAKNENAESNH
ncbi:glucagon receptor isoform X4 [Corythoichthys intestinalis]|uniref:glucagon receptor isoform X4 n=1 Tax=Corythoichthys intestinalis TaxID=161448 RepID=UPI0025A66F0E|nr:glucagon receptor isoform X4 [Corythoichthys intestinalis]